MKYLKRIFFYLKYAFQTYSIRLNIFYYKIVFKHQDPDKIVNKRLQKRNFQWGGGKITKIFLVLAVNDWEEELVKELSECYNTYLFTWPVVQDFFKNKERWRLFYTDLNNRLKTEFNLFYSEDENILVFFYASDFSISIDTIEYLKKRNTLLFSFCWDDLLYFKGRVKKQPVGVSNLSKAVDVNLSLSPEAIPRYAYNNSACYFWESIEVEKTENTMSYYLNRVYETEFYVLFIGSNYGWRSRFISKIKKAGINVICYGSGWSNGRLTNVEVKEKIRNAPLTLGFSNVGYTKNITTIKGRDFEVPLWGGLYLTQYSEGLKYYYEPNKELLTYYTVKDCIQKIYFIKENPKIAQEIRLAGQRRALSTSSWRSRLKYLKYLIEGIVDLNNSDRI